MLATVSEIHRKRIAKVLAAIPIVDLVLSIFSGSVIENGNQAAKNFIWLLSVIPIWMHVLIACVAAGLFFYDPVLRWYLKTESVLLGVAGEHRPQQTALPIVQKSAATRPQAKHNDPGFSGDLPDIILFRQMVRAGQVEGVARNHYPPPMVCPLCEGNGRKWGRYEGVCDLCHGTGELLGEFLGFPPCKLCEAKGRKWGRYEDRCKTCGGIGRRVPKNIFPS